MDFCKGVLLDSPPSIGSNGWKDPVNASNGIGGVGIRSGSSGANTPSSARPNRVLLKGDGWYAPCAAYLCTSSESSPRTYANPGSETGKVKILGSSYGEWMKIGSSVSGGGRWTDNRVGVCGAGEDVEGPASESAECDSSVASSIGSGASIPGGGATGGFDAVAGADDDAGVRPGGGLTVEVVNGTGFRFGDVWALFVPSDKLESVLFPRDMVVGFSFFSFFSLTTGGWTGDGVGRGKATLLLSGSAVVIDVGGLTGRDVPMGMDVRFAGRATGMPFPHAAEFGRAEAEIRGLSTIKTHRQLRPTLPTALASRIW